PPRGPATWGSPRWGRGCQPDRGFSRSLGGGYSDLALRRPWRRRRRRPGEGTPDRSKLFGSHGQRPWLHDVVILSVTELTWNNDMQLLSGTRWGWALDLA